MVIRCKSEGATGNGYMEVVRNVAGKIVQLYHISSVTVRLRKGGGFVQIRNQKRKFFKEFGDLHAKADAAGRAAVDALQVVPMVVQEHANMANDNSPVAKSYYVPDGVCGFASIIITPGNCPFANWAKKHLNAGKHYHGGVSIWVHDYNQSYQKKTAYAHAYGKVLAEAGIKGYVDSRLD